MNISLILTLLTTLATASSTFHTTTKDATPTVSAAAAAADIIADHPTTFPPICTFNPQKGEYECPESESTTKLTPKPGAEGMYTPDELESALDDVIIKEGKVATMAADCNKCQHDWSECMMKWGCWFYDCNGPCKCQVAKNDPSCKECPAGQCHA